MVKNRTNIGTNTRTNTRTNTGTNCKNIKIENILHCSVSHNITNNKIQQNMWLGEMERDTLMSHEIAKMYIRDTVEPIDSGKCIMYSCNKCDIPAKKFVIVNNKMYYMICTICQNTDNFKKEYVTRELKQSFKNCPKQPIAKKQYTEETRKEYITQKLKDAFTKHKIHIP